MHINRLLETELAVVTILINDLLILILHHVLANGVLILHLLKVLNLLFLDKLVLLLVINLLVYSFTEHLILIANWLTSVALIVLLNLLEKVLDGKIV